MAATPGASYPFPTQIASGQVAMASGASYPYLWSNLVHLASVFNVHVHPASDFPTGVFDTAGANLAAASTVTLTNPYHEITGTTTIANFSLTGAAEGYRVRLYFVSALTVQNNGGGTGNIRTKSGGDLAVAAGTTYEFWFDGTYWREGDY